MVQFIIDYTPSRLYKIVIKENRDMPMSTSFTDHLARVYEEVLQKLQQDQKIAVQKQEDRKKGEKEGSPDAEILASESIIEEEKKKRDKKRRLPVYYYIPSQSRATYSYNAYTPGGISIIRVPSTILGPKVLGRAFIGTNRVEILETLSGLAFEEVKRHEINHILNPYLGEWEIRQKTKAELPFEPYFH